MASQVIIVISTNVSNDLSTDTQYQSKSIPNGKQKIRITKSHILYYSNSTATFNLILSGDVKENPGPGFCKPKCNQCKKTVRSNKKHIICKCCKNYFYETCMKSGFVTVERTFTCSDCFFYELSFRNCHLPVDNLLINFNYENFVDFNPYLEMLNNHFN